MSPPCPNLQQLYGEAYRIAHDPAAVTWGERADPWMMQIPCAGRGVAIYPYGPGRLAVEVDRRPAVARALAALPGVTVAQDGGFGREMTFVFALELFPPVSAIVKPRRRRKLAETLKGAFAAGRAAGLNALLHGGIEAAPGVELGAKGSPPAQETLPGPTHARSAPVPGSPAVPPRLRWPRSVRG